MHTLIGAGAAEGAVDAANILKPSLARGELQVIGATTFAEYRKNTKVFCLNEFLCFLGGAASVYALSKLSAVTSSAINATAPIFMLFISLALKKMFDIRVKETITPHIMIKKLICFAVIIAGVVMVAL